MHSLAHPSRVILMVVAIVAASLALPLPSGAAPQQRPVKSSVTRHALSTAAVDRSVSAMSPADATEARRHANGRHVRVAAASAPTAVPEGLAVFGVVWADGTGEGTSVQYRQRGERGWGAWTFAAVDPAEGPDGPERAAASVRAGSEPIVLTGTAAVQVRLVAPASGKPAAGSQLIVVDPGQSPADPTVGAEAPGSAQALARRPVILSRADWGADESLRDQSGPTYGAVNGAIVHHTAGSNDYSAAQVPGIIRGIYAFHVQGNGWGDIGYNFLVDRFGRTWEGRFGGTTRAVVGAQASGMNYDTFGVSVLGNFDIAQPPSAAVGAVRDLVAWKAQIHEFDPTGVALVNGRRISAVSGHGDVNQTECPGRYLHAYLPWIRSSAGARVNDLPSLSIDRDLDNREGGDLLAATRTGELRLYSTTNRGALKPPITIGTRSGRDLFTIAGDFDGGGSADLVSRRTSDGALLLQVGDAAGDAQPGSPRVIGSGWQVMDALVGPGDWDGDGNPDLLARVRTDGTLRLYPGNGRGGFLRPRVVGTGWAGMRLISGVGDWNGDGAPDLIAVTTSGAARLYPGDGSGGFRSRVNLTGSWSGYTAIVGVGDATWDTRVDVIAVRSDGVARLGKIGASVAEVLWYTSSTALAGLTVYTD